MVKGEGEVLNNFVTEMFCFPITVLAPQSP